MSKASDNYFEFTENIWFYLGIYLYRYEKHKTLRKKTKVSRTLDHTV